MPRYVAFGFAGGSVIEPMLIDRYPWEISHRPFAKVKVLPAALAVACAGPQNVRVVAPPAVWTPAVHADERGEAPAPAAAEPASSANPASSDAYPRRERAVGVVGSL